MTQLTITVTPTELAKLSATGINNQRGDVFTTLIAKLQLAAYDRESNIAEVHMGETANRVYWRGEFIGNASMYHRGLAGRFWQVNLKPHGYRKSIRRKTLPALIDAVTEHMMKGI